MYCKWKNSKWFCNRLVKTALENLLLMNEAYIILTSDCKRQFQSKPIMCSYCFDKISNQSECEKPSTEEKLKISELREYC